MSYSWSQSLFDLCLWWAVWSLADAYLLPFSPIAECLVLGVLLAAAVVVHRCRKRKDYGTKLEASGNVGEVV